MEVFFEEVGESNVCRCCFSFSNERMDNLFELSFEDLELHEILNLIAPVSIEVDDGKEICKSCADQ